jgi:glucose/arabinose dehydrogenase
MWMTDRRHAGRRAERTARPIPIPGLVAVAFVLLAGCASGGGTGTAAPPRSATPSAPPTASQAATGSASAPSSSVASVPAGRVPPGASGPSGSPTARFDPNRVTVGFDEVVGGLTAPLGIANAADGSGRLFVVEQGGEIRIVHGGQLLATPFLDISDEISSGGERGLLGLAFHPRYPADPRLFVDYTDTNGDTRVSSFTVDPSRPDVVDRSSERRLLFVKQPYPNHNGGALAFGPDGFLYISLGDGGSGGDPQGNGQSLTTLLAKVLRIDVDRASGTNAYGIPTDNPFANGANGRRPEIWLTGLRNPWRLSFDRANGDLWIGDVGQGAWEEIDVQRAGVPGGTNFGWNRMEGTHCYQPSSSCEDPSLTLPVAEYGHDRGCTVIGGIVYRGKGQSALRGGYLFADYCSGRVWAIDPSTNDVRVPTIVASTKHSFTAFGEDEGGEAYAVDIAAGTLLRVTAAAR